MSFFKEHKTVMQQTLLDTQKEFIEKYDTKLLLEYPNDFMYEGAPLVKCYEKSEALESALELKKCSTNSNETKELMHRLSNNIVNIDNAGDYIKCVNMIYKIKARLGSLFYGALLIKDKIILNPLHPITAMLMLNQDHILHNFNYKIVIYSFRDEEAFENVSDYYNSSDSYIDIFDKQLNNIIKLSAHQVNTEISILNDDCVISKSGNIELKYQITKDPRENAEYELYLSAHQLLTEGIVYPYYGASIIKMNGNTSGKDITPMTSCNIANHINNDWGHVCTGSESNQTLKGLRTLNHANLLSPYRKNIMYDGAILFAQMAVDKSIELYKAANFIKGEEDE